MGLGTYPELSLALARKLTLEAKGLLVTGIDPKAQREHNNLQNCSGQLIPDSELSFLSATTGANPAL